MSMRYQGGVVSATPPTTSTTSATGVWTKEQQLKAQGAGTWPLAPWQISRSLRFNSADSAYLNRTPASAGNRKIWTWSGWIKRSNLGIQMLFNCDNGITDSTFGAISITASDTLNFSAYTTTWRTTTQVFRDPSAWYHIVVAFDTTQATAANRVRMYVNGTEITAFGTSNNPALNTDYAINQAAAHNLGRTYSSYGYYGGYMTEINFIDGQALTPSSFGWSDPATGVWVPIKYTGTYGTNGFYLNFSDNSGTTSTTLGKDYSGNGNNWTPNNFSVSAGAGNDSLVESPTAYGTDTGAGGEVRGNYCTLSPLQSNGGTLSNGNLDYATSTSTVFYSIGTVGVPSGKWYFEVRRNSGNSAYPFAGVFKQGGSVGTYLGETADAWTLVMDGTDNGKWRTNGTFSSNRLSNFVDGDIAMVAIDVDAGKVWFGRNGTWAESGAPASGTNAQYTNLSGTIAPAIAMYNAAGASVNFGQRAFSYTAPSGFQALCTQNLPTPTIGATPTTQAGKYFNPVLYTGSGATKSVTGVGFQPDLVWIKSRSNAEAHKLTDAVRGTTKSLDSTSTAAEATDSTGLTAFGSDGFTLGSGANYNTNTYTYVAWNWIANGSGSSNTSGTITSTVSANTTAGFSIATYTGTGSNATVGHGLGVAPSMVIVKCRNTAGENWQVYHISLTSAAYRLRLNTIDAQDSQPTMWNSTAPTSTVFSIGTASGVNANTQTYVAYCFAAVAGYSAFGSYTGNGSTDGPFVYTGFRPAMIWTKPTSETGNWNVLDNKRGTYNVNQPYLAQNSTQVEATVTYVDFLSNGFKIRYAGSTPNNNGATIIYAAFAEMPFKYAVAR